jgi:hypothetical protein
MSRELCTTPFFRRHAGEGDCVTIRKPGENTIFSRGYTPHFYDNYLQVILKTIFPGAITENNCGAVSKVGMTKL